MTTKTKILFVHHGKGLGGAPLSLLYLIQGLDKNLYHPMVLFLHDSEIINLYKSHNIQTFGPVNTMDFPHTKIWWFRWYHLPYLLRAIKDTLKTIFFVAPKMLEIIKPDILHLNTSSLIAWGFVAHYKNIPIAWHIREPLAHGYFGFRKKLITWCVNKFSCAIIPISRHDGLPWKNLVKTTVVHNAVTKTRFNFTIKPAGFYKKYNLDPETPKILFLGGLSREKGTHVILDVFAQLKNIIPDVQLLIAGDTNNLNKKQSGLKKLLPTAHFNKTIAKKIKTLGASIKLLGTIHDIPEVMAASTIIVFPATVGHFARPIIEAGFMKKPVVASCLAPLDELVINEKTGFLVSHESITLWVQTLAKLIQDPVLCEKTGEAAYQFCTEHFNLENHAIKIQTIYEKIYSPESINEPPRAS